MKYPLIAHATAATVFAYRNGQAVSAGQFVADATALAQRMRAASSGPLRYVVNACADRYVFAVTLAAGLIGGWVNLLPGSRAPRALADLAERYPEHIAVGDTAAAVEHLRAFSLQLLARCEESHAAVWPPPAIDRAAHAAIVFTSGSTGEPMPQLKTWGSLVDGAQAERVALGFDGPNAAEFALVGTVAPQHMYGLESTVLLALQGPLVLTAAHPLHPEQIIAALAALPGHTHRVLVTTPVHLRALAAGDESLPDLDRIICATAPLSEELAASCEERWSTRVLEIYGCSEAGQVASRRTVDGPNWRTLAGVRVEARESGFWVSGGHVQVPAVLADHLLLQDASNFVLEGRTADLVNVAGKRTSLAALNHALLEIDGVRDGTFFIPDVAGDALEARLMAFVVAPGVERAAIVAGLRRRVDPVFLPRPLVLVESLPRNANGKLPRAELARLAADFAQARS